MKKFKTIAIAFICILALTLSLTSCDFLKYGFFDEEGNFVGLDNLFGNNDEENEDIFDIQNGIQLGEPYTLNYISNGDGTCYVTIRVNADTLSSVDKVVIGQRDGSDAFAFWGNGDYSVENKDIVVINPSKGVIGSAGIPSLNSNAIYTSVANVEIPSHSPDGDTVTGIGNSNFLTYPNVPRILDKETFEALSDSLRAGLGNDSFNYQKVMACYSIQDPNESVSESIQEMHQKYPVTKEVAVYVLDQSTSLYELSVLSELLETYAGYTVADCKNDFDAFKSRVAQKDASLADTLDFGNAGYKITRVVLPETVTEIDDYAFAGCYNMEHVEIHSDITEIGEGAFYGCKKLQTVHLNNGGLTEIEDRAFMLCEGLQNISLPDGVTEIGERAFYGCKRLQAIDIPTTLQRIEAEAFFGCETLGSIYIPYATTYIGANAFTNCSSLASADFDRTDGWVCTDRDGNTEFVTLSDSATNSTYLTSRWHDYTWT